MKIHIVIPVYNNYHLTNNILWSLYKQDKAQIDTVLVVNDCSSDPEVVSGLKWWESHGILPIRSIHNKENMGFLKSSNLGIETISNFSSTAPDDIIILLSNDVRVEGKFLQSLKETIKEQPYSLVGGVLYLNDTGWNNFDGVIFPYLEGWLLAATQATWKELGGFDERYCPSDFEDVHLSTKAAAMGYNLIPLNSPVISHMGGQTIKYGEKRLAQTLRNKEVFRKIWIKE